MDYQDYNAEIFAVVLFIVLFPIFFLLQRGWLLRLLLYGYPALWVVYRLVGYARYHLGRRAWMHAADELGLEYAEETSAPPPGRRSGLVDDLLIFVVLLANSRVNFSLQGRLRYVPVSVRTAKTSLGRTTVYESELPDAVPDWLHVQKGSASASAGQWFGVEDVLVGSPEFDQKFLVGGENKEAIREFFVEHDLEELLVDIGQNIRNLRIEDGTFRVEQPGPVRLAGSFVDRIESFAEAARLLHAAVDPSAVRFDDEQLEAEFREASSDEAAHVYE